MWKRPSAKRIAETLKRLGGKWEKVRGFPKYHVCEDGRILGLRGWLLKPRLNRPVKDYGRLQVHLYRGDGSRFLAMRVHTVVLTTFIGPKPNGCEASHLNGNPLDNRRENLAWETPKENTRRKLDHGTYEFGELNPNCHLTAADVAAIKEMRKNGDYLLCIAKRFKVSESCISLIVNGIRRQKG